MKYTRKRKARGGNNGQVIATPKLAKTLNDDTATACDEHVSRQVRGADNIRDGKPYWERFGYTDLETARIDIEKWARTQYPCAGDPVLGTAAPSAPPPPNPTVRGSTPRQRPSNPFGPKGSVQPDEVGPGCTGPFCMPKGGKSRRRKGRKSRRRITRRR